MENISLYIYLIGSFIALILGIIEIIKDKNNDHPKEYGMICPMILLSWITVFLYILNSDIIRKRWKTDIDQPN